MSLQAQIGRLVKRGAHDKDIAVTLDCDAAYVRAARHRLGLKANPVYDPSLAEIEYRLASAQKLVAKLERLRLAKLGH